MNSETEAIENLGVEEILNVLRTRYETLEDRIETLEKEISYKDELIYEIADLKEWRKEREGEDARREQRVIDLELTLRAKENGRRDYDLLATKLMREVLRRHRCLDYRDIVGFGHFKTSEEGYRLMDRTQKNYPEYVQIRKIKKGRGTKKVICKV
jgi:hypothetical protein